jgi:hypothetical protein
MSRNTKRGEVPSSAFYEETYCRIVVSFVNQCGAIAETTRSEVSPGLSGTRKEAEDRSLAACRAAAGQACTLATSVCSVK